MQKRKEKNKLLLIIGIVYYISGLLLLAYVISIPILNSKKEHSHENNIYAIIKIGDGLIISGDSNGIIKVW